MNSTSVPGECPECGEEVQYGEMEIDDNNLYRECECLGCGWTGREWYQLTYVETMTNGDEEDDDVYDDNNGHVFKW